MSSDKVKSQTELIKEYLEDGLTLSRVEAFKMGFGLNLPARIQDLKKQGLNIGSIPAYEGSRERKYFIVGKYNG